MNIEADAELGMPLDLVGMPGIFDGDESCKLHLLSFWSSNHITERDNLADLLN